MTVEADPTSSSVYLDDLNATYPAGADAKSEGDNHMRLIKKTLKNTFPNIDSAVTASDEELNLLDGVTSTTAELNILDGVTSTAAELNILDGVTATAAELNYVDVTTLGTMQASKALTADANNTLTVPDGGEINFASGSQLQIGGSAVTFDKLGAPVLVTATDTTSGTEHELSTAIPSWAKRITVTLDGVSTNGTSPVQVQLGTSGGYATSGYLVGVLAATGLSTAVEAKTSGFVLDSNGDAATSVREGMITFVNVSGNQWVGHGMVYDSGITRVVTLAGSVTLADALTSVKLTTVNGTDAFDAGKAGLVYD